LSGSFNGDGANVTNVNAATLGGLSSSNFWQTSGNAGADPTNGSFLGTTDSLPLEIKVNGQRALRIENAPHYYYGYSPNFLGGFSGNIISDGIVGAVIGGGGFLSQPNVVGNNLATVVGGAGNTASGVASTAMGSANTASGFISTAIGSGNTADGIYSVAMGESAKALHNWSFVWSDGIDFASTGVNQFCIRAGGGVQLNGNTSMFFGTTTRQMLNFYGLGFGIGVQTATLYSRSNTRFSWFINGSHSNTEDDPGPGGTRAMTLTAAGLVVNGAFVSSSDRNMKENFAPVQPREVLEKVAALPLSSWNYKADAPTRHLGPMAQDFYAAFGIGPDDKHIATVDAEGVALAAIQGLNQKLEEQRAENAELKQRLERLEQFLSHKNGGAK
jgi:hypothetical protein